MKDVIDVVAKPVREPGYRTPLQWFSAGWRRGWNESLAPTIGRVALAAICVILACMAVIGLLAAS